MNKIIIVVFLILIIPFTHFSHLYLNEVYTEQKIKIDQKFNLPSPELTQVVTLGFDNFVADLLWLQLIQYVGSTVDVDIVLPEMYSLINNIITLDPKFTDAYIFGAFALTDNKEFDKAANVLERGMIANPNEWYIPYQLGFLYYIYKKNKPAAARYLEKASKTNNAPLSIKNIAAIMYSSLSLDIEIKISLWQSVYDKALKEGDSRTRDKAYKKLIELKIESDIQKLRDAIAKYNDMRQKTIQVVLPEKNTDNLKNNTVKLQKTETGKPSMDQLTDLRQLKKEGLIQKIPLDPFNRPYIFNPETQEIQPFPLPWKVNG